jgi:beta-phosphoglucomutase-like phosphatase (HAD superfamily)
VAEEAEEEEAEAAEAEAEEEAAEAEAEEEEGDEDVMPGSYSYLKNLRQRASTRPYGLPVGPWP